MLKPSDFNNAVPQFQNGNYASNPINPQYVEEPSSTEYNRGTEPLQTLPAQWWNWFMNKFTSRFNKVNIYVKNLFNELAQLLSLVNVTPDGTEGAVTDGQLKNAFKELYPDYINTKLALKSTYVKKTQKVNGHALSGDITVTKSDVGLGNVPNVSTNDQTPTYTKASTLTALSSGEKLSIAFGKLAKAVSSLISHIANVSNPHSVTKAQVGLGSVVNTGDSATPIENGTTKFTTGGAYTLKKDLTDIAESLPTDAVLHYSFDEVPDYPDGTNIYYKNKNWITTDNWSVYASGHGTISVENGVLTSTRATATISSFQHTFAMPAGTIIKLKIVDTSDTVINVYRFTNGSFVNVKTISLKANIPSEAIISIDEASTSLMIRNSYAVEVGKLQIETIYIGDGSYTTPIIDNANGQNNAINIGGIATNGVSGKGVYFPSADQSATIRTTKLPAPTSNDNFTISFWLNISTSYIADGGSVTKPIVETGSTVGTYGFVRQNNNILIYCRDSENVNFCNISMDKGKWHNYIGVYNGSEHRFYLYVDGVYIGRTNANIADFQFGSNNAQWRIWSNSAIGGSGDVVKNQPATLDDLLIFDRALTKTEVMALYLNKANTPKYYNINNYILDNTDSTPTQNSTNLVTSGGVYTELAKKANTTYVDTELAKKVDKTTTVNGHALSGNVTVTKSDVDLGNVVNTGDSAVPVSGGTTKFTTGGAYNLLTSLAPIFSTSISYAVGDMVTYSGKLYTCTTAHSAGAWDPSHFTVTDLNTEFQKPANNIAEDFQVNKAYEKGQLVIYNKELYKCIRTTNVQLTAWDATKFQKVSMYTKSSDMATSLTRYVLNVSLNGVVHLVSLPALCAGSELLLRLDNDSSKSGEIKLEAHHVYTLGVTYSDGGISTLQKLTSGQKLSVTVPANSYLEVSVNYIDVDDDGIASFTMFTYPIPSVTNN